MKKIIVAVSLMAVILSGCNYKVFDTTYRFDEAIIRLPNGTIISGEIEEWSDYEGDQLQIKIDGITYLVHASNAVMISK